MRKCVLYVVSKRGGFREDAITSRDSIKRHNPDMHCVIVTDYTQGMDAGWDEVIVAPPLQHESTMWFLDSTIWTVHAFNTLYNRFDAILILDSDTYCAAPLDDLFRLADRFDICGSHGVLRQTTKVYGDVPASFPELEIGALLVRTNATVCSVFTDWLDLYNQHPEVYGNNDQGPLREAMWINKQAQVYAFPEEYHCRWGFGVCVNGVVHILHGRSPEHPNSKAAEDINATGGRRLFKPDGVWWRPLIGEHKGEYRP